MSELILDMTSDDLDRPGGVGEAYQTALISQEAIDALAEARPFDARAYSGMLNDFWTAGRSRQGAITPSIADEMRVGLTRAGPGYAYRGQLLSEDQVPRRILAFATYWESVERDALVRRSDADGYVTAVRTVLGSLRWDAGLNAEEFIENAADMLLFDTIFGPNGNAVRLVPYLAPRWQAAGYRWVLLYRHKVLSVPSHRGSSTCCHLVPCGNNDRSEWFLRQYGGFRDIGTRLSDRYAVRGEHLVLATEGWMIAEIEALLRTRAG